MLPEGDMLLLSRHTQAEIVVMENENQRVQE